MISTGNDRLTQSAPIAADQTVGASIAAPDSGCRVDSPPDQRQWMFFWIAAVASALPMLCFYLVGLWKVEHYQFFPLVFAFVIGLAHSRSDGIIYAPRGPIAYTLIAFGLLSIAISVVIFSPWFTAVGFVLIVSCLLAALKEPNGRTLSVLVLPLLSLVRLPLNFDSLLITGLQAYTSRIASWFLDLAAVPHLVSGNIIELVNQDLFVAEACSGIQSVFTLLFLSSLILAYRRRPLWMAPGYWAVALLVAVLCNSFRVATVSAAASFGIDWATGLNHTLVGYVALGSAFILLLSFDQCIELFVHPIEGFVFEAENWTNPLIRRWDRYIVGKYPLPTGDKFGLHTQPGGDTRPATASGNIAGKQNTELADSRATRERTLQPAQVDHATAQSTDPRSRFPTRFPLPSNAYWYTFATASVLMLASLFVAIKQSWNATPQPLFVKSDQLFQPAPSVLAGLPASVRILGHEVVRDAENPRLGESADIWTVGTANWQGQLVLSQTYSQWHELCYCYQILQWRLNDRSVIQAATNTTEPETGLRDRPGFVLATFQQGISSRGYLLFSAITYDGKLATPPVTQGPIGQLVNRLSLDESSHMGDMMMLQLWIESAEEMSASDLDLAKEVFGEARDRLLVAVQTTTGN